MTQDQIMGLLRQLLPVLGTLATSLGILTADQVGSITATVLTLAGPVMIVGGAIWALFANSKTSIIKSAAAMGETRVTPNETSTTIEVLDPNLAHVAAQAATPPAGGL